MARITGGPYRWTWVPPEVAERREPPPTRLSAEPIPGWKRADIRVTDAGGAVFAGVGVGSRHPYGAEATATCDTAWRPWRTWKIVRTKPITAVQYSGDHPVVCELDYEVVPDDESHDVPELGCGCGFYAVPERHGLKYFAGAGGVATLQVDLSGRVVVHRHGYRAARQRVLRAELDPLCSFCEAPASQVALGPGYAVAPVCTAEHFFRGVLSVDELAERLGTEVGWAAEHYGPPPGSFAHQVGLMRANAGAFGVAMQQAVNQAQRLMVHHVFPALPATSDGPNRAERRAKPSSPPAQLPPPGASQAAHDARLAARQAALGPLRPPKDVFKITGV